jgi:hypothetical protein
MSFYQALIFGAMQLGTYPRDFKTVAAWTRIVIDRLYFVPSHVFDFDFIVCITRHRTQRSSIQRSKSTSRRTIVDHVGRMRSSSLGWQL